MRFCFQFGWLIAPALAMMLAPAMCASSAKHVGQSMRVRSVVRADVKTGRLIRAVVVTPKVVAPRVMPVSQDTPAQNTVLTEPVSELVETVARQYDVDPLLVHSVIQVESAYNPYAVSHKGAQGLMQLMPGTARRFGVRNTFDTRENIEGGVRYLKYLDSLFPNDIRLTLAAYNAGEGAVWKYRNNIPPYRETEQYVYKVGTKYGKALRDAGKKKAAQPVAVSPVTGSVEPSYARVESYVDSDGRLHLRTANTP